MTDNYEEKLLAFLEALEIQNIPELIQRDVEFFTKLGEVMAASIKSMLVQNFLKSDQ